MELPKTPKSIIQAGFAQIVILILFLALLFGIGFYYLKPKPSIVPPATLTLSLDSPSDETLVTGNTVSVRGETNPNAVVVFYTETSENSVDADANGNFEGTIELTEGINTLVVTAFSEDGQEKSVSVDVVYDSQADTY